MQNAVSDGGPFGWLQDAWRKRFVSDATPPSQSSIANQLKVQTEVYLLYHPDKLPMLANRLRAAAYSSNEKTGFMRSPWLKGALEKLPSAQDLQARLSSLKPTTADIAQETGSSNSGGKGSSSSSSSRGGSRSEKSIKSSGSSSSKAQASNPSLASGKSRAGSGAIRRGGADDSYDPDDDESWDEGDEADANDEAFQICKGKLEMTELMHEVLWVTTNKRLGVRRGRNSMTWGAVSKGKVPVSLRCHESSSLHESKGGGGVDRDREQTVGVRSGLNGLLHWALPLDILDEDELQVAGAEVSDIKQI